MSYNGFYFAGTGGTPAGFPTRDASDYIKLKKQTALYRGYQGTSVTTGSPLAFNNSFVVPVDYTIVQGNQTRLSYQFGAVGCPGCAGSFPTQLNVGN